MPWVNKAITFQFFAMAHGFQQRPMTMSAASSKWLWQKTTSQENVHDAIFMFQKAADNLYYLHISDDSGL
ncbi:hypothetical protein [Desulfovibrio sp.]|uniref:hypothetical protein n=1 Tax=Desulfovibrio sp. TaxID=885 RepID=UPI0025C40225|nr:hypothetical protein [Desulfovibrio sp.]